MLCSPLPISFLGTYSLTQLVLSEALLGWICRYQQTGDTMAEPKFEWYQDKAGKYRFRLVAPNGETIATSEGYSSKDGCVNGIESVKKNAPIAKVVEAKD